MQWKAQWIWMDQGETGRNAFVRFRRRFEWGGQVVNPAGGQANGEVKSEAKLHVTADSRYILYINGEYLGQGPIRGWPQYYPFDTYDLTPYLVEGENSIAILVQHFGEGNFQYNAGPPGLLAQLEDADGGVLLVTDESWRWSGEPSIEQVVPRISVQLPFEEQVDARLADGWTHPAYDDSGWRPAKTVGPAEAPPRTRLEPRDIPFLTLEPTSPVRIVSVDEVAPVNPGHVWTIAMKPYLAPDDLTSNKPFYHAYLHTQIYSPHAVSGSIIWPHLAPLLCKVNGVETAKAAPLRPDQQANATPIELKAGWNSVLFRARGSSHLLEVTMVFDVPAELRFACLGEKGGSPWALIGPFGLSEKELERAHTGMDRHVVLCLPQHSKATVEQGEALWARGDGSFSELPYYQQIRPEHLPRVNVYASSYTDEVVTSGSVAEAEANGRIDQPQALLSQSPEWTTVYPASDGRDVRVLLDFGREVLGYHRFEVDAPAGTILDWHNFEFIQPDGRHNLAEGMNNSFRYICREGRQQYQSFVRRGFQYSWLTLRNMSGPVRIRFVDVLFNSYPQARQGSFQSSDEMLNRIWEVGAHTLRCSAEDTYTDCPTYEQTHWVGDARNEALIDWMANGDSRLWHHCLLQAARSLERSPLVESHVPSSWQNVLPAWSFLWVRSVREYALYIGVNDQVRHLLDWVKKNMDGVAAHIDENGLFSIHAWNMFDWAAMDTPSVGVVTHQNCLAVLALKDAAELATWCGETMLAEEWEAMAEGLTEAINIHLWNEEKQAYTDCLRDGAHSSVYSQQTQTAAFMSGVARGERAKRCYELLCNPPGDFVKAGSPFFAFFLLEAYMRQGADQEFLDLIREDWGFMIEKGATTFWEMWSWILPGGRLTRSHCHGWSGAPTFFLSTHVLGVTPVETGSRKVLVAPHPGDLAWCRGRVPTPAGPVEVQWENPAGEPFCLRISAPAGVEVDVAPPRPDSEVWVNGEKRG